MLSIKTVKRGQRQANYVYCTLRIQYANMQLTSLLIEFLQQIELSATDIPRLLATCERIGLGFDLAQLN